MGKKVLLGSPVRQKPQILEQFLRGIEDLDLQGFSLSCFFVDDNVDESSSALLRDFSKTKDVRLLCGADIATRETDKYASDSVTHFWDTDTITKIAAFKDHIIEYAIEQQYDYLFLVDSDIVLDKRTLQQLASRNVEIVSNVFWTQWKPNWQLEPQCFWMPDLSRRERAPFSGTLDLEEARQMRRDFFAKMRIPGLYRVDGLGACTLIARSALVKGVRFRIIPNLALLGEDRHFCVRAGALGIALYMDTVYPVYHIYREEYLNRVEEFRQRGFQFDMCQTYTQAVLPEKREPELLRLLRKGCEYTRRIWNNHIVRRKEDRPVYDKSEVGKRVELMICVDENNCQFFEETLLSARNAAEHISILACDAEGIEQICEKNLDAAQYEIIHAKKAEKGQAYKEMWARAGRFAPGWILSLECGEVLPENAAEKIGFLIDNPNLDAYRFPRYDMWNRDAYRDDALWNAHRDCPTYLLRYQAGYSYHWNEKSRFEKFPIAIKDAAYAVIPLKVKNVRWSETGLRALAAAERDPSLSDEMLKSLEDENPSVSLFSQLPEEI